MHTIRLATALLSFVALSAGAQPPPPPSGFYLQHNLVSDQAGVADLQDTSLVNAWGLVSSSTSPWWVANNGSDTSTVYNTSGSSGQPVVKVPISTLDCKCVLVSGDPTGVVFNANNSGPGASFKIGTGAAARFIFDAEDGSISGWNGTSSTATVIIQASDKVYKGLAIFNSTSTPGNDLLYATDFHNGKVDVYNSSFVLQNNPGAFTDKKIPKGYAPFGIRNIGGVIYVTYAKQDADAHDDVAGPGHGFINAFTTDGKLIRRVASRGTLNSPWGLAMAPADFGEFSNDLLVGNFGDGRIHAFEAPKHDNEKSHNRGALRAADGKKLVIDGLWSLSFGNGSSAGPMDTLFFTAGPDGESHGLFGSLVVTNPPAKGKPDSDDDAADGNDDDADG